MANAKHQLKEADRKNDEVDQYNHKETMQEKIAKEVGIQITDIPKWVQFDELWADTVKVQEEAIQRNKTLG